MPGDHTNGHIRVDGGTCCMIGTRWMICLSLPLSRAVIVRRQPAKCIELLGDPSVRAGVGTAAPADCSTTGQHGPATSASRANLCKERSQSQYAGSQRRSLPAKSEPSWRPPYSTVSCWHIFCNLVRPRATQERREAGAPGLSVPAGDWDVGSRAQRCRAAAADAVLARRRGSAQCWRGAGRRSLRHSHGIR